LTSTSSNTESDLLRLTANNNQLAFKALVDLYWQKVYGHALAYTRSVALAEELTQDVFMAIWNTRSKLALLDNFANYLFIITRNRILKAVRRKLIETISTDNALLVEEIWVPDKQAEYKEFYQSVLSAIEYLPPVRKRVFIMNRIDGLTYEQICQNLKISRNTVKEHVVKSLNFLRIYFDTHNGKVFSLIISGLLFS